MKYIMIAWLVLTLFAVCFCRAADYTSPNATAFDLLVAESAADLKQRQLDAKVERENKLRQEIRQEVLEEMIRTAPLFRKPPIQVEVEFVY